MSAPYNGYAQTCDFFYDVAGWEPTESQIRERAYELWIAAGRPNGRAEDHWFQARAQLERTIFRSVDNE